MKQKKVLSYKKRLQCFAIAVCLLFALGSALFFTSQQKRVIAHAETDGITGFVGRLYTVILNRTPDEAGLAEWTGYLQDGTFTGAEVAEGFIMSEEFLGKDMTNEEFVRILYLAFFGREADVSGLETWTDALDEGYRKSYVFAGFANSTEFGSLCDGYGVERGSVPVTVSEQQPNLSEEEYNIWLFVERLYTEVLERTPDMLGIKEWVEYLQEGTFTGAEVAEGFIMSEEFLGKDMSNEEYVQIMYKAFFGREADASGLETWVTALETEYTKEYVFAGFANSTEFGVLCESYGISQGEVGEPEVKPIPTVTITPTPTPTNTPTPTPTATPTPTNTPTPTPTATPTPTPVLPNPNLSLQQRMDVLYNLLGNKYCTVSQTACSIERESGHGCTNCNMRDITDADWFRAIFGEVDVDNFPEHDVNDNLRDHTGQSCFGFACFAQWFIYADSSTDKVDAQRLAAVAFNKSNMQKYVKPGDVVRVNGHSVLVYSVEADGLMVIDSNWNSGGQLNCLVQKHLLSYTNTNYAGYTAYINRVGVTAKEKMDVLYDLLGMKYCTVNQTACSTERLSGHGCTNCNMRDIANTTWFKNLFGTVNVDNFPEHDVNGSRRDHTGQSCFGFACFAQWFVYADSNSEKLTGERIAAVTFNKTNMEKYVQPGDVVRVNGHSVLVYSIESNGLMVIDSNWNSGGQLNCLVQKHLLSYSNTYYVGYTAYINRVVGKSEGMVGGQEPDDSLELESTVGCLDLSATSWTGYNVGLDVEMNADKAYTIYDGAELKLLGKYVNSKGNTIYHVYSYDLQMECYISAKYVKEIITDDSTVSDWVMASDCPAGAEIVDSKWTYTYTERTTSASTALDGWIRDGEAVEVVETGSFDYAFFPDTFDTSHAVYKGMYASKNDALVTDGTTREIISDVPGGYVYWHYSYPVSDSSVGNRIIGYYYKQNLTSVGSWCYATEFSAFKSATNYTSTATNKAGGGTIYKITDSEYMKYDVAKGSYWWYRFAYNTCTYQDVKTVYQYHRTIEKESTTEVTAGNDISNVVKWVKYK